jgi:hypothetical protein
MLILKTFLSVKHSILGFVALYIFSICFACLKLKLHTSLIFASRTIILKKCEVIFNAVFN